MEKERPRYVENHSEWCPDYQRALEFEGQLKTLTDSLFKPEFVGPIEIRPCFAYKSSEPPTFNLYRGEKCIAQMIPTKTRARAFAKVEAILAGQGV